MTQYISLEFLVAVLFIVDLVLIFLLFLFVRRVKQISSHGSGQTHAGEDETVQEGQEAARIAADSARNVMEMLNPLVEASKVAALEFEGLIREKKKISKDLNDALDSKMISINLLLSRAETLQKKLEARQQMVMHSQPSAGPVFSTVKAVDVLDQQNQIIDLYYQQVDIDTIAEQLSIPKGEVQLVIDLKEKFIAMEQAQ